MRASIDIDEPGIRVTNDPVCLIRHVGSRISAHHDGSCLNLKAVPSMEGR